MLFLGHNWIQKNHCLVLAHERFGDTHIESAEVFLNSEENFNATMCILLEK